MPFICTPIHVARTQINRRILLSRGAVQQVLMQSMTWLASSDATLVSANHMIGASATAKRSVNGMTWRSLYAADAIAQTFRASPVASASTCRALARRACAVVYSACLRVQWMQRTKRFPFRIAHGAKLDPQSLASVFFASGVAEREPRTLPRSPGSARGRTIRTVPYASVFALSNA